MVAHALLIVKLVLRQINLISVKNVTNKTTSYWKNQQRIPLSVSVCVKMATTLKSKDVYLVINPAINAMDQKKKIVNQILVKKKRSILGTKLLKLVNVKMAIILKKKNKIVSRAIHLVRNVLAQKKISVKNVIKIVITQNKTS